MKNKLKELKNDEYIWLIFIIISIFNILGDEYEKKYYIYHIKKEKQQSKKIFTITLFISLLIYIYLENQRINHLKECIIKNQNTLFWQIRCFGGILIITSTLLFLYCQILEPEPENSMIL